MKLAVVRARYNPAGGAERFVQLATSALVANGTECAIVARRWPEDAALQSLEVIRVDPFYLGRTWRDWSFARGVHRLFARRAFDLVQSHERIEGLDVYRAGDGVHADWLERRAARVGPVERLGMRFNLHHRYLCHVERRMFDSPRLRAVVCNSIMVRDEIRARFAVPEERLHVIYNGVDLDRFNPIHQEPHRTSMRQRLSIGANDPVLLFVGSGFERKGLGDAIRALARNEGMTLVVVGHDKHQAHYLEVAKRLGVLARCRFIGAAADAAPYYALADLLVLPTWYDPFPNVALEALASGLPVIVSDACGAREIVTDGENGYVVPVGQHLLLDERIKRWRALHGSAAGDAMCRAARRSAESLGVERMAAQMQALYRHLEPGTT